MKSRPDSTLMKIITTKSVALANVLWIATLVSAAAGDAKENWSKSCAKCHGPVGSGQTVMGKKLKLADLTDAKVQAGMTDGAISKAIKEGTTKDGKTMKAVAGLSDDDVKALVKHVRSLKK